MLLVFDFLEVTSRVRLIQRGRINRPARYPQQKTEYDQIHSVVEKEHVSGAPVILEEHEACHVDSLYDRQIESTLQHVVVEERPREVTA